MKTMGDYDRGHLCSKDKELETIMIFLLSIWIHVKIKSNNAFGWDRVSGFPFDP